MIFAFVFLLTPLASAHVTVSPKQVKPGERVTFSVSVPNEKDVAVSGLRLELPAGLSDVTPTVKPGWVIQTGKADDKITAITWSEGQIPAGQRDDFSFRAQAPSEDDELHWKAYQTYADGTTVAWDNDPSNTTETADTGPYSITKVSETTETLDSQTTDTSDVVVLAISLLALVLSVLALTRRRSQTK